MAQQPQAVNWVKVVGGWVGVLAICSSIGAAATWIITTLEARVTSVINAHDHGYPSQKDGPSHGDLRVSIEESKTRVVRSEAVDRANYEDLKKLFYYLVSYTAADREPRRELRAAAAEFYRGRFLELAESSCVAVDPRRCRPDNRPYLHDVYSKALAELWPGRGSLVRLLR